MSFMIPPVFLATITSVGPHPALRSTHVGEFSAPTTVWLLELAAMLGYALLLWLVRRTDGKRNLDAPQPPERPPPPPGRRAPCLGKIEAMCDRPVPLRSEERLAA